MMDRIVSSPRSDRLRLAMVPVLLLGLGGCATLMANMIKSEKVESRTFTVTGRPSITAETFNGAITVTAIPENKVEAVVKKTGSGSTRENADADLEKVVVEFAQEGDSIRIVARRTTRLTAGSSGAEIELKVPVEAALALKTSNGKIETEGTTRGVIAHTSNGEIEVEGAGGKLDLETTNGSIEVDGHGVEVSADTSNGDISFVGSLGRGRHTLRTSNGSIAVELPGSAGFQFDAGTSNGTVTSTFPAFRPSRQDKSRKHLAGQVGPAAESGVDLALETSNGNITIKPRPEVEQGGGASRE